MISRRLYITLPSGIARIVDLSSITMIGRDSENDIVLDNAMISRYHAMLLVESQSIVLIDLESTNGTLVNGTLVLPDTPVPIKDGMIITLGQVSARYCEELIDMQLHEEPGTLLLM
jgi:pSer/pThr/pTyr-binding forkhead associated (FHA) protein